MSESEGIIPGVQITPFGVTHGERASLRAHGGGPPSSHALFRLTIEPGRALPDGYSYQSMLIDVQEGHIEVETQGGAARVWTGLGPSIRSAPDAEPFCDHGGCPLPDDVPALLEKGNGFSLDGGTLHLRATGDRPAVITLTVVLQQPDFHDPLCWICPVVTK